MKIELAIVVGFVLSGCAAHSTYDTDRFRQRDYNIDKITLSEQGKLLGEKISELFKQGD